MCNPAFFNPSSLSLPVSYFHLISSQPAVEISQQLPFAIAHCRAAVHQQCHTIVYLFIFNSKWRQIKSTSSYANLELALPLAFRSISFSRAVHLQAPTWWVIRLVSPDAIDDTDLSAEQRRCSCSSRHIRNLFSLTNSPILISSFNPQECPTFSELSVIGLPK